MTLNEAPEVVRQLFADAHSVLIASHIRPDGDAVGSLLGLGLALENAGKAVRMVLNDGVPTSFHHLPGWQKVQRSAPLELIHTFDLVITVDCSDLQRAGGVLGERKPDLSIDHHITNLGFARYNVIEPEEAATSVILTKYLEAWGLCFDQPIAEALLTGIVTDTLGFRTNNMSPTPLRLAAMLMEYGADLPDLYHRALISKTFEAAKFWGMGLSRLQRDEQPNGSATLAWTSLTLEDRKQADYPGNDDADLINVLSTIDSDAVVIFVEQKNQHVKVSWRARAGIDVAQIALQFGGGGHPSAAGADIPGSLETVQANVLAATRATLAHYQSKTNGK